LTPPSEAVVDASVALKWVLNEAASSWARALPSNTRLSAPTLLWTECANGLWRLARSVPEFDAGHAFGIVSTAPVEVVEVGLEVQAQALRLGGRLGHPGYDCLYLALALDRGAALATADARFLRVLRHAAVLPSDRLLAPLAAPA
jgi:predicted nucleic acid-binding protein